ncbi:MAG: hypothetical protein EOO01_19665 [Chitinophagaceae bacterium]|nr:MAG: hypothetical protein EOO01_19665 [Chitinophagaceae bacterium]
MFRKVYHITFRKNRESILDKGLLPFGWQDKECRWRSFRYSRRIYVSTVFNDPYALDLVDYEGVDIWEFVALKKNLVRDDRASSANHFFIRDPVPPAAIRLVKALDYWPRRRRPETTRLIEQVGLDAVTL